MSERVCAVVVTHNRKELLQECLTALERQCRPPDSVIVVDNASTDGTRGLVASQFPHVHVVALPNNQGGAGGFHEGLKAAHATAADWIWLMDDDTIASETALRELLVAPAALESLPEPVLLSSRAVWTDGRLHPMNQPVFSRDLEHVVEAGSRGYMPMRATTFVSLLVRRSVVDRHGLPLKHYFIWSDDIEYTARVLRAEAGYVAPASVVHHKTVNAHTAVSDAGGRFYFHVRNVLYMSRSSAWSTREKLPLGWQLLSTTLAYLRANAFSRESVWVVIRGIYDGLRPPR